MDGKTTEKENFASVILTFVDRVSGSNNLRIDWIFLSREESVGKVA